MSNNSNTLSKYDDFISYFSENEGAEEQSTNDLFRNFMWSDYVRRPSHIISNHPAPVNMVYTNQSLCYIPHSGKFAPPLESHLKKVLLSISTLSL